MGHLETVVLKKIQLDASAKGWRLFRNSTGHAWQGRVTEDRPVLDSKGQSIGRIELIGARRVVFGLAVGSSDLIGWRPVVITQDMVGKTVAQFVSIECKTKAYKKTTPEQDNWLEQVALAGGAAFIAQEKGEDYSLHAID